MADEVLEMRIVVSNFSDLMPDSFNGEGFAYDCEYFYRRFRSWVQFQDSRLPDDATKVEAFKYMLSDTAILLWNGVLAAGNVPGTLNKLRDLFYTKFRVSKTIQELKRELKEYKYVPGMSCLPMIKQISGNL